MPKTNKAKHIRVEDFSEYRIAEFWSKTKLTHTGCIEYTGATRVNGYGVIEMKGRTPRSHRRCLAHRAAYAMTWGDCPAELHLLHSCDNPRCVNPVHLTLGTHTDNMRDMASKKRHWKQRGEKEWVSLPKSN